jgi:TnpA family transposase
MNGERRQGNRGTLPNFVSSRCSAKSHRLLCPWWCNCWVKAFWSEQNYLRDETLIAANATRVSAQNRIPLAQAWGGGEIASADGLRFIGPIRTGHAGPNPKDFGVGRGVTWYNLMSNPCSGLHAMTVPGTLRDSLVLLAVVLEQQTA